VSIATIAEEAGLAPATVSFILNGHAKRHGIADKTARRVLRIAEKLHYVPNEAARSIRRQGTRTLGVLFAHFRHECADQVVDGMHGPLRRSGYVPFIAVHRFNSEWERREVLSLVERGVEALISVPLAEDTANYEPALRHGVPLVFLGDTVEHLPEANYVAWDAGGAVAETVRYMIQTGRRRIAFLGWDLQRPFVKARHRAYCTTLAEAGVEVNEEWQALLPTSESRKYRAGQAVATALRKMFSGGRARPDAVVASGDTLDTDALAALKDMGYRVPEDVSLASVSTLPLISHPSIGLPRVPVPSREIGRVAARTALELIRNPSAAPIQRVVPCGEMQVPRVSVRPRSPRR